MSKGNLIVTGKSKLIHVRVPQDWVSKLQYLSDSESVSISWLIRRSIQQMFHRRGDKIWPRKADGAGAENAGNKENPKG